MTSQPPHDPYHDPRADEAALRQAQEVFGSYREGILQFDETQREVRFITDPDDGRIVMPVPEATFHTAQHVLFVPQEDDDALQLLLTVQRTEEGIMTDRWMAYHGEPEEVRWATCWIDSAKHGPWVFDGNAFMIGNPLSTGEAKLCKLINAQREALCAACRSQLDLDIEDPTCVGVDAHGLYVRARFGVVRLHFQQTVSDAEHAREQIEALLRVAS